MSFRLEKSFSGDDFWSFSKRQSFAVEMAKRQSFAVEMAKRQSFAVEVAKRQSFAVEVGCVKLGGDNPVLVQSMTDTITSDVSATVSQICDLVEAGSELVRVTVDTATAAAAVVEIKERLLQRNITTPLIGDFHYNGHDLLANNNDCAKALDKYRINPGNVGFGSKRDRRFTDIIELALLYDKPVRIGVNWGSLDQDLLARMMDKNSASVIPLSSSEILLEAIIESALVSARLAESIGMKPNKLILSAKVSSVKSLVYIYRVLASRSKYALHLGLTEAGMGMKAIISSCAALSPLLLEGIGDTIRISLTPSPDASRIKEVEVARHLLQSVSLRQFVPTVTSCPGCGRTGSSYFRHLACQVEEYIQYCMKKWRVERPEAVSLRIAVMGCIVNGPGESRHADIGISLPGNNEHPRAPVFIDGKKFTTLAGDDIFAKFRKIIEDYVEQRYPKKEGK